MASSLSLVAVPGPPNSVSLAELRRLVVTREHISCNITRVISMNWKYGMCGSVGSIPGAAPTVNCNIRVYSALETGRCVSLQKARRKRRHDYPDAKVETERVVLYSLRRRRKIVAALRPETEIEERGVSIKKARRKRKHDINNLAIIHVSSCNDVLALQKMYISYRVGASLHVHVSTTCFILHAAYLILHVHVPTIICLLFRTCL